MGEAKVDMEKFRSYSKLSVYDQMKVFLKAFFRDADIDFNEVYRLANKFHWALGGDDAKAFEMEEDQAHKYLGAIGKTMTATALRTTLKKYDVDRNNKMSLVEFFLFHFDKSLEALMTNDVDGDPALLEALRNVKAEIKGYNDEKTALYAKIKELETVTGVKAFGAKNEITEINTKTIPEIDRKIEKAEKVLVKAQKAVDDYGSEVEKLLVSKGLTKFVKEKGT